MTILYWICISTHRATRGVRQWWQDQGVIGRQILIRAGAALATLAALLLIAFLLGH